MTALNRRTCTPPRREFLREASPAVRGHSDYTTATSVASDSRALRWSSFFFYATFTRMNENLLPADRRPVPSDGSPVQSWPMVVILGEA